MKHFTHLRLLATAFLLAFVGGSTALAQCALGSAYGSGIAPSAGNNVDITTCAFGGEYSTISSVVSGDDFTVTYTGGSSNYVTIFDNTFTAIAWGTSPVSFTATYSGTYYSQANVDDGLCSTESSCRTANWANTTPLPPCAPQTAPWLDDLESMTPTTSFGIENCWTEASPGSYDWNIDGSGSTPSGLTGPSGAYSGSNYFYVEASNGSNGDTAYLESPEVDMSGLSVPVLQFRSHMYGSTMGDLYVQAWDGSQWVTVGAIYGQQQTASTDPWDLQNFYLTGIPSTTHFRFAAVRSTNFYGDISIDDIAVIESTATCPEPGLLSATNVTATSLDLGWIENGSATTWNIEYGTSGFTPTGVPTIGGTMNNPENITGLNPTTSYDFYVQADCGADSSIWVGPYTVTTPCMPEVAPWIEEFATASLPVCWSQSGATTWEYGSQAIGGFAAYGAANVTDYSASGTTTFIGMDGSDNTAGEVSYLYSPMIDVSGLALPMFQYAVFSNNVDDAAQNQLLVELWDGAAWNTMETIQANLGPDWVLYSYILDNITFTGDAQIRFTLTGSSVGSPFYNDILIDDVQLIETPPCPDPSGLTLVASDLTSADFSWTQGYQETQWILEYGPVGFTPGTGTMVGTTNNPDGVTGLTSYQFYDMYVYAYCGVGDTSNAVGPVTFNTYNQGMYMEYDTDCPTAGFIDISATGTGTALSDDGTIGITLPFPVLYQGTFMTTATISNNGYVILGTLTGGNYYSGNMTSVADGLYPFLDDLDSEEGDVYYQAMGTPGNQTFIVQWDTRPHFSGVIGQNVTVQLQLDEASGEIYFVYEDVEFGGSQAYADFGASADIGIAGPTQDINVSNQNGQYLTDNSCAHFYYTDCPKPQNLTVTYTTTSEGAITWNAGMSNETNWTVIYGLEGFDPSTSGTTIQTTSNALIIPGLNDITTYDVYVYADCDTATQSFGIMTSFTTLPNCADPTGLAGTTAIDSIFTNWNWTANPGYNISEFAFEYGPTGFSNGAGSYMWGVDTVSYADTIADATLMSAGLYDVYVQAICGTDSSNWVGPITVTMPMTNDSTCMAQDIPVDGVDYSFNGTGATVATGETAVAPAAGTCTGNMTWCNSLMSFTTWYTFTAPASGNVRISGDYQAFDGQVAVYEVTQCDDFNTYTLLGANDDDPNGTSGAPFLNLCGLTPGNTYYMVHDPYSSTTTGIYSLRIEEVAVEAGTDNGLLNICLGDTVDLNTQLTGADAGGTWTEYIPTANFEDPIWVSAGLASQVFTFQYMVVDGCAMDSVETQVEVYAPSSAGIDGVITVCKNEPVDLLSGLSGTVDHGGQWYDPSNNAISSSAITAGSVPGQFNYDYIAGNGVCPNDTANVILDVSPTCDYLSLQEAYFEGMELYPNPTTDVFYITNTGSTEVYSYELTDLNGKLITSKDAAINGVEETEVNVHNLETGVYLIRIFNENSQRTYRVVKQ